MWQSRCKGESWVSPYKCTDCSCWCSGFLSSSSRGSGECCICLSWQRGKNSVQRLKDWLSCLLRRNQRTLRQQPMNCLNSFCVPYEFLHHNSCHLWCAQRVHAHDTESACMRCSRLNCPRRPSFHLESPLSVCVPNCTRCYWFMALEKAVFWSSHCHTSWLC